MPPPLSIDWTAASEVINHQAPLFMWEAHPLYPFLFFFNRDEYHSRPAEPLGMCHRSLWLHFAVIVFFPILMRVSINHYAGRFGSHGASSSSILRDAAAVSGEFKSSWNDWWENGLKQM
ncbi:hypothetical protein COLO4_32090 [Corchorus olitorius]|uniref:Uncharacterized protein n=1 Tax=Corchorus olitorius TaxID=93759 RepID=A0A1R3H1K7_9ROSI|nr:hypothetical protein COLO4_32090 [Corchorus olitorius]